MEKKKKVKKVRDYVAMQEYMNGTGVGAHRSLKDRKKDRKSKESKKEINELKKFLG